ncbi:MAG TPA: hypothetical protein VM618_02990, partial [Acidimicrobiia bacterium]|nr:hypothetical protein [Acidimicrobiia bacterium]
MTFYVSLVLVIVAAVTLVIGLLQSGLWLVIVSIGASFLAGVFLILTVMRERPQVQPGGVPAAGVPAAAGPPPAPSAMEPAGEELEFPIADYDELKVSEIVPLLPELDDDELDMVREREEDTKGRATILNRIDELLAESEEEWAEEEEPEPATAPVAVYDGADDEEEFPIADYDELKVSEIVPLLPELDDDEL